LPVIAEFLKGTVSESLTKLVQPAGLVPATFFALLNLAFIYPAAHADQIGLANTFAGLDETWQVVVVAALILAIGYLLLNSANAIIEILSGDSWRGAGLSWLLRRWQLKRHQRLQARCDNPRLTDNRTALAWRLATEFPIGADTARYIQPTRLGNVLGATQHTIWERYGLDMVALWSHMESAKGAKDTPALAVAKDEKATLDLLANLIFILVAFAIEGLVFFSLRDRFGDALLALLALLPAYVAYRVATSSARSWGSAIGVVFDLHRDELRKELGLREKSGVDDERKLWRQARRFYLPGQPSPLSAGLFEKVADLKATVTAAPALKVDQVAIEIVGLVEDALEWKVGEKEQVKDPKARILRSVEYVFVVSRVGEAERWADADVIVDDPRLERIGFRPANIREGAIGATAHDRSVGHSRLQWRVSGLKTGASLLVVYRLPLWRLALTTNAAFPTITAEPDRFTLAFDKAGRGKQVTVALTSYAAPPLAQPKLRSAGEEVPFPYDHPARTFTAKTTVPQGGQPLSLTLPSIGGGA
jgi:hypothetical protein